MPLEWYWFALAALILLAIYQQVASCNLSGRAILSASYENGACVQCVQLTGEAKTSLFCDHSAELGIGFKLRVNVSDCFRRMTKPELDQVFRHSRFPQVRRAESAETVKALFFYSQFFQDRMQRSAQKIRLMQRSTRPVFEEVPRFSGTHKLSEFCGEW